MRCWFVVVLALASCSKKDDPAPAVKPAPAPTAVAPAAGPTLDVYVDDKAIAHLPLAALQNWPRLDSLVPQAARRLGTWDDVFVKTAAEKPSQLHRPSDTYPQLVPAVYVTADQKLGFGMFDPVELAKKGKAEVHEEGVTEIRIALAKSGGRGEHDDQASGAQDLGQLKISFKTPKGESTLESTKLFAIPREPMPGEGEQKGWTLATIIKAGGITKFDKVLLTDSSGLNLTLEKADFSAESIPYVKLNRQGSLRVQVYKKKGNGWDRSGDLRGLVAIEQLR
jgi:hypothetical protein